MGNKNRKRRRAAQPESRTPGGRSPAGSTAGLPDQPPFDFHDHLAFYSNPDADIVANTTSAVDGRRLTVADRFHALPSEIRDEIFAWLLVRPVKWNCQHQPDCRRRRSIDPYEDIRPMFDPFKHTCASSYSYAPSWRRNNKPIWIDPWRSQWAPEQSNPYLCSLCYDHRHRPQPYPVTFSKGLPCLCARRANLQTLLVCRRWYEEAGRVFYSQNRFAFGHVRECWTFLDNLSDKWKLLLTKVSIIAFSPAHVNPETAEGDIKHALVPVEGGSGLLDVWRRLQQLPALSELEVDAVMLTRLEAIRVFRQPAFPNLRSIKFVQALPVSARKHREFVWPRLALRKEITDSYFAEQLARGIKGRQHAWSRGPKPIPDKRAVEHEKQLYANRFKRIEKQEHRYDDNERDDDDDDYEDDEFGWSALI